jgi:NADPH-dependent ferric siderophore reductase
MFFDGIHRYTTTTVVGSVRMMEFCVFEAMSQLVSPQTMLDVDDSVDKIYIYAPASNNVQHFDNEPPHPSTRSIQESPAQSLELPKTQINKLSCYSHCENLNNLPFCCRKSLRYSSPKIQFQLYLTDHHSLPLPIQHLQ